MTTLIKIVTSHELGMLTTSAQWINMLMKLDVDATDSVELQQILNFVKPRWFDVYLMREGSTPVHPVSEYFIQSDMTQQVGNRVMDVMCSLFDLVRFPPQCWDDLIGMNTQTQLMMHHVDHVQNTIKFIHILKLLYLGILVTATPVMVDHERDPKNHEQEIIHNAHVSLTGPTENENIFADNFHDADMTKVVMPKLNQTISITKLQPKIKELVHDVIHDSRNQRLRIKTLRGVLSMHKQFGRAHENIFSGIDDQVKTYHKYASRSQVTIFRDIIDLPIINFDGSNLMIDVDGNLWVNQKEFKTTESKSNLLRQYKTITGIAVDLKKLDVEYIDDNDEFADDVGSWDDTISVHALEYFLNEEMWEAVKIVIDYFVSIYKNTDASFWHHVLMITDKYTAHIDEHWNELFHTLMDMILFVWHTNHTEKSFTSSQEHIRTARHHAEFLRQHITIEFGAHDVVIKVKHASTGNKPSVAKLHHNMNPKRRQNALRK